MKWLIVVLLLLTSNPVFASCFVINGLQGIGARKADDYIVSPDQSSAGRIMVEIEGKQSRVSSNQYQCQQLSVYSLLCTMSNATQSLAETWLLDPQINKVLYTKTVSGFGAYDGVNAFVGKIIARCDGE